MVGAFSIVCLAVLPHAPRFVAFDRGMLASNSDHGYQASVQPSLRTTAVIPAALRTGEFSSVGTTVKVIHARATAGRQASPANVVTARLNAAPPRERVVAISATADQEIVPQFRTLVFIEATQYMTSDSAVWSVQVWRVTLVTQVRERLAKAPIANSI
jgi:hypothetical protein